MLETTEYLWTTIRVNGIQKATSIASGANYYCSSVHSPKLLQVKQGDDIDLWKLNEEADTLRGGESSYMTVMVVN